ncbi:MAG TPA: Rrf2 family transcriptional regulator [Microlunatus sp.]
MARPTSTQFAVAVHVLTYLSGVAAEARPEDPAAEARPESPPAEPRPGSSASQARSVSSEELALSAHANAVHVRRVLGPLREAGLVLSRPGPRGGWALGWPAEEITVAQVWDLVQGHEPVLGLHGPNPACPVGRSIQQSLTDLDARARQAVRTELDRVTVADLATAVVV